MRLAELHPKLAGGWLRFDCPHCRATKIRVPVDEHGAWANEGKWRISGQFPDTTTLDPSIDASASGHWHGTISNGEVT